jgi:acetolactate synthase-1/3 small subunit
MALITVNAQAGVQRQEVLSLVGVFRSKVVDISETQMIVEASGNKEKVEAFIELLRPIGIHEITRTGRIAIGRLSNITARPSADDDEDSYAVSSS